MPLAVGIGQSAPPADTVDSVVGFGAVTAPGAGGAIVANLTPAAGTYLVRGTGAGSPVAADVGNMQLNKNGSLFAKLGNPIANVAPMPPIRITLNGTDTIGVVAIAAATAGVVYTATLSLQRLY
jgi:hypothetical protein